MENEPDKSPSSGPPPPDLPPPPPPSMPPPPDLPPPPPPSTLPTTSEMPPSRPVDAPAKSTTDYDEEEDEAPPGSDAAFETRAIAGIIDAFVASGLYWVVAMIIPRLAILAWIGYMLVRDALPFMEGHSLGKRIMKIKAVTLEGKSLSGDWGTSVTRNILLAIPLVGLIELVVLFTRKDRGGSLRRLGDEWAKTKVIVAKEPSAL